LNADNEIAGIGGDVCGYNAFAYCFNNPVNMSDPTGNWPSWNDIKQGAKKAWNTITSAAKTAWNYVTAFANSFEYEAGAGAGLKLGVEVLDVEVEAGMKGNFVNLELSNQGFEATNTMEASIAVNIGPLKIGPQCSDKSPLVHDNCTDENCTHYDNYTESFVTIAPWTTFDVINIEGYFLYGGSINVRFNMETFSEELIKLYE